MNIRQIQNYLKSHHLDWLVIPRSDEFLGEYVPACNERLKWATGFSGSAGVALVGQSAAYLFVDGRYTLQAPAEASECEVKSLSDLWSELSKLVSPAQKVVVNLKFHAQRFVEQLKLLKSELIHVDPHPVDELWQDRPDFPTTQVFSHPLKYAGESINSKLQRVVATMREGVDALYVHDPHDVAWLLNIRARDLDYTPIPLCRAVVYSTGKAELFLHHQNLSQDVKESFEQFVTLRSMEEIDQALFMSDRVQVDPAASAYDHQRLGGRAHREKLPIEGFKAIKNAVEIDGMRQAHALDGKAVQQFILWLKQTAIDSISEITAADKLEEFRKESDNFVCPSFPTISGVGSNGAIVHYHATEATNRSFAPNEMYLVDSGGQYPFGTTDITRTLILCKPTEEQRRHYTLVLRGHIRLAKAIFPKGTTGHQLDAFARLDLWQHGLDYAHGTGHGVGSFSSVHEGPGSISPRMNDVPLEAGMILSNEPGYYKAGEYGIRIENMMLVKESDFDGFLCFETLTRVPYESELIDERLLSSEEKEYLETYEKWCDLT